MWQKLWLKNARVNRQPPPAAKDDSQIKGMSGWWGTLVICSSLGSGRMAAQVSFPVIAYPNIVAAVPGDVLDW